MLLGGVHAFYTVAALTIAHLMRRHATRAGIDLSVRRLLASLADIQETVLLYQGDTGRPRARWYDRMADEMPATLAHFDYRLDNLFFGPDDSLAVIDFQASCVGPGVADLGYFLSQSVPIDLRRTHHDGLVSGGVDDYSRAQLDDDLRVAASYAVIIPVFAVGTLDSSSERAMTLWTNVMERQVAILLDLGIDTDIP